MFLLYFCLSLRWSNPAFQNLLTCVILLYTLILTSFIIVSCQTIYCMKAKYQLFSCHFIERIAGMYFTSTQYFNPSNIFVQISSLRWEIFSLNRKEQKYLLLSHIEEETWVLISYKTHSRKHLATIGILTIPYLLWVPNILVQD